MKPLAILITKAPFGTIHAAEATRLANGAVAYGHEVSILLVGDGVLVAKSGQRAEDTGCTSLSPLLQKLASSGRTRVLADIDSARLRGLDESDIMGGIRLVDSSTISSTAANSQRTVIF